jgi:transposase-like protein
MPLLYGNDCDFKCPLCGSESYEKLAYSTNNDPIHKCSRCHFHFTDPTQHQKRKGVDRDVHPSR